MIHIWERALPLTPQSWFLYRFCFMGSKICLGNTNTVRNSLLTNYNFKLFVILLIVMVK
ncbi:hypothetical protein N752_06030 [Desulforamulus aquiferis]|nr:hypothetical protein N752_06030 [Desulforamulus aquiferis]